MNLTESERSELIGITKKFLETQDYDKFFYRDINEFTNFERTIVCFLIREDIVAFTKWIFYHVQGQVFLIQPFHHKIFQPFSLAGEVQPHVD